MGHPFDGRPAWLVGSVVIAVVVLAVVGLGAVGYVIAARRAKQPFRAFLARYWISFSCLYFLEFALLVSWPRFHTTMRNLTAMLVGPVLSLAGASHTVSASTIILENPNLSFNIDVACLGGLLLWVYIGLVLAESNATTRQRFVAIVAGLAALLAFNFLRIALSIYLEWATGVRVHDYFYLLNIGFVLLAWGGWLRSLRPKAGRRAESPPGERTRTQNSRAPLE